MGSDQRMREIFEADRYVPHGQTDGYFWCAAFKCVCIALATTTEPVFAVSRRPQIPGANRFKTNWAVPQRCLIGLPSAGFIPHKGDIVLYNLHKVGDHIDGSGSLCPSRLVAIEGNTNAQGNRSGTTCRRKWRPMSKVNCFMRLPVYKATSVTR